MATKTLNTRIALKYDSLTNWLDETKEGLGANLVLLKGELGICEIPAIEDEISNVAPTVLFKVGGAKYPEDHEKAGQLMAFKDLPWVSAKAADVYSWAKASDVVLEGKTIKFIGTDKTITLNYLTEAEVKSITDPISANVSGLDNRLKLVEESLGLREDDGGEAAGSVAEMLGEFSSQLETIRGDGEGSIKKAEADAKAYTDEKEAEIRTDLSEVLTGAFTRICELEGKDTNHEATDAALSAAITAEETARKAADSDIDLRLSSVEDKVTAFFDGAAEDSEGLNDALDKLVDIQKYLNGEGEGAKDLLSRVAENAEAIENLTDDLSGVRTVANNTAASLAELTGTVNTATGKITSLQNTVTDASKVNEKLRSDVDSLQTLTSDSVKGNEALYTSLTALTNTVSDTTTGLAATYAIADKNKSDIETLNGKVAAIEGREANYISDTDQIIFKCGSASENTFVENKEATTTILLPLNSVSNLEVGESFILE
jgi:uncharacterized coiled-coil protein SlyX